MTATRNPIRFAEKVNCPCGAPRPFGEPYCADCRDLEEEESFLGGPHDDYEYDRRRDDRACGETYFSEAELTAYERRGEY